MTTGPVGVGIIGAGVISSTYLENLTAMPDVTVLAVGDLNPDAATTRADEFGIGVHGTPDVVLDHPDIEIVVNLTIPRAHAEVALATISRGKHAYCEKPLATDLASGRAVLEAAEVAGVRVGCAPDTFLGEGLQTALRLVNSGAIGRPLTATASFSKPGPENWHPNPEFLFQPGGGPLLDDGPYYFTALVQALGPAVSVRATASSSREKRTIKTGPRSGTEFEVLVPTYYAYQLRFASGALAIGSFSMDSPAYTSTLDVVGMDMAVKLPDPNRFDGPVSTLSYDDDPFTWNVRETTAKSSRGTGVLDLARAIRQGRPHRASGELAFHVLDMMMATQAAVDSGDEVEISSTVKEISPLPDDWDPFVRTVD